VYGLFYPRADRTLDLMDHLRLFTNNQSPGYPCFHYD
jgi:hypothetical protein